MKEYFKLDGEPIKCYNCKSSKIEIRVKDTINDVVCERAYYCKDCGWYLAYWAYGYFDGNEGMRGE